MLMRIKKFLCVIAFVIILNSCAYSGERSLLKFGLLSKLNSSEQEFAETWKKTFAPNNRNFDIILRFYESLINMLMGLNADEINEMVLPEAVAEYVLNVNSDLTASLVLNSGGMGLAFGFRADNKELRDKFNEAILNLKNNWTLSALEGLYIASPGIGEPEPVKFEKFKKAGTIKVAVTGDLPPIDLITASGVPAGFNTAVLAEIGNYLKMNVELIEINSGARNAALASGRADVVFWYEIDNTKEIQPDIPDGIILSSPYYEWNKFIHVRKKLKADNKENWDVRKNLLMLYSTPR